ncbi:MAG TPA: cache domain-containing protein, partial [Candidatus Limnocylindria bacterium]|nr:cache domain-containing protein [Candidatus Limnocylindria bacterium]
QGGGWVTYQWLNATKVSYVKEVKKDDMTFTIGVGYYPHSKVDAVVNLVKGAVALFNDVVKGGRSKEEALATFSYPMGRFVYGDLYLYAVDFNGIQLAHGENPELIGSNALMYHDSAGKLVNQEIISKLKLVDFGTGVWVDYISRNAPKRAYAEKVKDASGKLYFIACGYYPDADRKHVEELVRRGYKYMKANGKSMAVQEFTDKANNNFRYGDLYLFVYDTKGVCIAHGDNPTRIGMNMMDARGENGRLYVREFITQAEKGGGWVDHKEKGAFTSAYVEMIDLGSERYVIGSQIYPISKRDTMILVAKGAADYLRNHDNEEAFREFVDPEGKFVRGDLEVFACDTNGICFAAGDEYNLIWNNLMNVKDDTGKPYVKMMINTIRQNRAPSTLTYTLHGATRVVYAEPVEKGGKTYVVSSGFYY